jgi:HK97 family phage prohead protease
VTTATDARQLGVSVTKHGRAHVIKAAGQTGSDLKPGQFSAIVSVFNNVDSYGDVMMPGAFLNTLADYLAKGNPIPVIWSHDWQNPDSHIGYALDAQEVPANKFGGDSPPGLWILGQNDIETNARAAQVSRLMAGGRITQFSFAYDEINAGWGVFNGMENWLVHEVALHEVGPTLLGVNQDTTLIGAKRFIVDLAQHAKAGARHSDADTKSLAAIHAALVDLGVPCGDAKHVPSDQTGTKNDSQGSTDGTTDAARGDGGGASNLRAADVTMLLDLELSEVD